MKISARLSRVIDRKILPFVLNCNYRRSASIHSHKLNKLFVTSHHSNNIVEIPLFAGNLFYKDPNIIKPLCIQGSYTYKTVDSILYTILNNQSRLDDEIIKVSSEKFGEYYGTNGLIMDNNFRVLFMTVMVCSLTDDELKVNSYKAYVHPIVSIAETSVEKAIYTKLVPKCITEYFNINTGNNIDLKTFSSVEVVFEDVTNKFIVKPLAPSNMDYNEEIKSLMANNIDDIVNTAIRCL